MVQVRIDTRFFTDNDQAMWDGLALAHPQGSPFHLIAWKRTIEQVFGYEPHYLMALRGQEVEGILPLFLVRNFLMGRALISSPFAVYGGVLANSAEAREALGERVRQLGNELGVQHIELRNAYADQCVATPNVSRYVTFTYDIGPKEDDMLRAMDASTRNKVRKSQKQPFASRIVRNPENFERLYSKNLRRLGTPAFPREHFTALMNHFGPMVDVREIVVGDKVVAASFNFIFRDQMHIYYSASDPGYNHLAANNYMYWDHLLWARRNGYVFDFGRSKKDTGVFEFKRHWGATMRELPYEMLLVKRKELPNFSPTNPKFQLAIRVWQRLPLPVTRMLGPQLVRLFP